MKWEAFWATFMARSGSSSVAFSASVDEGAGVGVGAGFTFGFSFAMLGPGLTFSKNLRRKES
jgi:hypothetical protein